MAPLTAYRAAAVLIWALALWNSLWARGLFLDGHFLLLGILKYDGFHLFYDQRLHLMAVTQSLAVLANRLGVTDTQVLAQLLSFGLFAVPTAFYHAALFRARRDPLVLAAVVCAIAAVFMPTSFFIVGEYNSLCAIAIFTATLLATNARLTAADGLMLCATAALTLKSYELTLVVGPWLAILIAWRVAVSQWRTYATMLYVLAAVLFFGSGVVAAQALLTPHEAGFAQGSLANAVNFWRNLQFDLPFAALVVVAILILAAPEKLASRRTLLWPGVFLAALVASPLLWLTGGEVRPFAKSQYESRVAAVLLAVAIATVIFVSAVAPRLLTRSLAVVRRPAVVRNVLLIQFVALVAALPADLVMTEIWRRSLVEFQATIARQGGFIDVETTALVREPHRHMIEYWALPSESLVLRRRLDDGIVVPPAHFRTWQPFGAAKDAPDTRRYLWGWTARGGP